MRDFDYHFDVEGEIPSPQLVFYIDCIDSNIKSMIDVAGTSRLWPHIKTHKCAEIVAMMRKLGISRFKCATIAEAEMLASLAVPDILLAYPIVGPNIKRFVTLADRYKDSRFWCIGDDIDQLEALDKEATVAYLNFNLLVDVDCGMGRTGVEIGEVENFCKRLDSFRSLFFSGFHVYDGHRHEPELEERKKYVEILDGKIDCLKEKIEKSMGKKLIVVAGGTPSFVPHALFSDYFLSPGTCILSDAGYRQDVAELDVIPAAAILSRVISSDSKGRFTLDLGYKGIASDPSVDRRGIIVGHENVESVFQNEEHWVFRMKEGFEEDAPVVGDVLFVIPWHVCPSVAMYDHAVIVQEKRFVGTWGITARDRKISI